MSAMKERIARVLSDAMYGHADEENPFTWGRSLKLAESILGEMYEPTDEMVHKAERVNGHSDARESWRAMTYEAMK